tara:strand:+ start:1002 stop:1643 length:642 start_codon:yes stop_codon:yes gene_type:complete
MNKIYVISLDNELGKNRRDLLNYEYTWFKGIDGDFPEEEILKKVYIRPKTSKKIQRSKYGSFNSYYRLFEKIIENKENKVIIVEDDCFIKSPIDMDLGDKPLYLNGRLSHPKNWNKNIKFMKENTIGFKNGVNEIDYDKYRIASHWGLYFPTWQDVDSLFQKLKSLKKWTWIDLTIMKKKWIKHLYYPSLFYHNDFKKNTYGEGFGLWDNYTY